MKNMLNYQSSEFDCGPTSLINAIRFLFEREEIPPVLLKGVWQFCNDTFNEQGEAGKHGTSKACMRFMGAWLNEYAATCHFPLCTAYAEGEAALMREDSAAVQCLRDGGAVVLRCFLGKYGHYVLLTGLEEDGVALFDPYEMGEEYPFAADIRRVNDQPRCCNRVVPFARLLDTGREDYNAGNDDKREVLMLRRRAD